MSSFDEYDSDPTDADTRILSIACQQPELNRLTEGR